MNVRPGELAPNTVLSELTPTALADLAAACQRRSLRPGEPLYRQGDPADAMYFQLDGRSRAFLQLGGRKPLLIHASLPHDGSHGLRDLLARRPRETSVVAQTPTTFAALGADDALALFQREPSVLLGCVREMSNGLDRYAQHAADLGVLDLPRRVAKHLLDPVDATIRHRASQDDIARSLGATRQSVNKTLTSLQARGWVERRLDGTIGLVRPDAVRRFVEGASPPRKRTGPPSTRSVSDAQWAARGDVLAALGDDSLRAVSRTARYRRGEVIRQQGEQPTHLVVVLAGAAQVTSTSGARGTYVHHDVRAGGATLGLTALFRDEPPTTTLRASSAVTALEVPRAALADAVVRSPAALLQVAREVCADLVAVLHTAAELAVLTSTARVACVLLALADDNGRVTLGLRQRELADRVGLSRQSVNRALTTLRTDGLVEVDDAGLLVPDRAALHRFVYLEDVGRRAVP